MVDGFRYPLTRICLRTGSLTLPLNLLGVFPERGEVLATDTERGSEFVLQVIGRRVLGLTDYFERCQLGPNDELVITTLDDGRYAFTAVKRPPKPERPPLAERAARLIESLLSHGQPVSEAEIRGLFPELVVDMALRPVLEAEPRLVRKQDRWMARQPTPEVETQHAIPAPTQPAPTPLIEAAPHDPVVNQASTPALANAAPGAAAPAVPEAPADPLDFARQRTRKQLAAHAEDDALAAARQQREARAAQRRSEAGLDDEVDDTFAWDQPLVRRLRFPWQRRRDEGPTTEVKPSEEPLRLDRLGEARPVARPVERAPERPLAAPQGSRVNAAPRANLFADEGPATPLPAGDPKLSKRARDAFTSLGYRVEGLAFGQLMLHADYGRRAERILVHVLADNQRLPWGALLQRRREAGASHMAVIGQQLDLQQLTAPADLARATLWSWAGLERVLEVARTMPMGPFDLQAHFDRDGMNDFGLDRFERTVGKRLQERAAFSVIMERLAQMKAPAVFLLEEIASEADIPREQTLRVLERLADAPWHLVTRVDSGEFCLRYRVHEALEQVQTYAGMLRDRLPERQLDRVRGYSDGVDPIMADEVLAEPSERHQRARAEATVEPPREARAKAQRGK